MAMWNAILGRFVTTRMKELIRCTKEWGTEIFVMVKHSSETNHSINLDVTKVLVPMEHIYRKKLR